MFSVGSGNTKRCHVLLHSYHGLWTRFVLVFFVLCGFHLKVALEFSVGEVSQFNCHFHEFCSWLWVRLVLCYVVFGYVLLMFSCGLVKSTKEVVSGRAGRVLSHYLFLFCFVCFFFWGQV